MQHLQTNRWLAVSVLANFLFIIIFFGNKVPFVTERFSAAMGALQKEPKLATVQLSVLPPESPIKYKDNKNGTVLDEYTGLLWAKCPIGMSGATCKSGSVSQLDWGEARLACEKLRLASKTGWRLPTLKELQSIVDTTSMPYAINTQFFGSNDDPYWTETSPSIYPHNKFSVLFSDGTVYFRDQNNMIATRCVHTNK